MAVGVYVICCNKDYIKIGIAAEPRKRMAYLQTGCPYQLSMLRVFIPEDAKQAEAALHSALSRYHVRGEWFKAPDSVRRTLLEADTVDAALSILTAGRIARHKLSYATLAEFAPELTDSDGEQSGDIPQTTTCGIDDHPETVEMGGFEGFEA